MCDGARKARFVASNPCIRPCAVSKSSGGVMLLSISGIFNPLQFPPLGIKRVFRGIHRQSWTIKSKSSYARPLRAKARGGQHPGATRPRPEAGQCPAPAPSKPRRELPTRSKRRLCRKSALQGAKAAPKGKGVDLGAGVAATPLEAVLWPSRTLVWDANKVSS